MWPKEEIPDESMVFMFIHRMWVRNGEVIPGAFQDRGGGMSVDWDEHSTAEETRQRARRPPENGVISLGVGIIRSIQGLTVEHDPIQENTHDLQGNTIRPNRAHSEVLGEKNDERRLKLSRIYSWEIHLS